MIKSRFSFISEGIGFLLITVSAFLCSYYYEIGQCVYYSIPTDYISFDLTMRGKLLFLMFTAFSFGVCMFYYFPLIDRVKNGILRKGIRIAFSIFFLLIFLFSILTPLMFESLILLSAFFGAIVLWAVIYNKGNVSSIKGAEYWKHKILLIPRPAGTFISSWMVYSILGCFIFMNIGYISGVNTFMYPVSGGNRALVKRYDGISFYCEVKRDTLIFRKIYVVENPNMDTFQYRWLNKGNGFGGF